MTGIVLLTLGLLVPGVAVSTEPSLPTPDTPVTVVIASECACPAHLLPISRTDFTLDVPYSLLCLDPCAPTDIARYDVGLLDPGLYTVRHFPQGDPENLQVIGTFAVVDTSIPRFDPKGWLALAVAVSAIGTLMLRSA